jgi:thiol-disulfide isomerase/thioredoxin
MTTRRTLLQAALSAGPLAATGMAWAQAPKPMLSGTTPRGESVSLESLRGSVVLVFVWSTRCPVCLDKLPELRRNLDGWQGKPFVILALNQDRSIDDMLGYQRLLEQTAPPRPQMKHLWRSAPAHRDNFGELPVNMPTTMVFDKEGALSKTLRGRVPAELWDDIAELVLG